MAKFFCIYFDRFRSLQTQCYQLFEDIQQNPHTIEYYLMAESCTHIRFCSLRYFSYLCIVKQIVNIYESNK